MNEMIGLPINDIDLDFITPENTTIDMSNLSFPVDKDKQDNAALLYIRNMSINATFVFDKCSYESKAWFLNGFLKKNNFELNIKELSDTWIHILADGFFDHSDLHQFSILTIDEISKFVKDNSDYIFEIRRFITSIPLVSIDHFKDYLQDKSYSNFDISEFDCSQYPRTSFNMINMPAFINILKDDATITLQQIFSDHIEPIWYSEYFDMNDDNGYYSDLIKSFPYLDMLNILTPDNDALRDTFIDELINHLNSQIETTEEDEMD